MRILLISLLTAAALVAPAAQADKHGTSPLIGEWAVDVARLPMPPEMRPKRVSISFANPKIGTLKTLVEVIDPTGATMVAESAAQLDGTPTAVQGNLEADAAAVTMPVPGVLVMQLAREGIPASTRVYTVAADGKTMVETSAYVGPDGKPVLRTNHFSRVK